jgi:hypothetical protein
MLKKFMLKKSNQKGDINHYYVKMREVFGVYIGTRNEMTAH